MKRTWAMIAALVVASIVLRVGSALAETRRYAVVIGANEGQASDVILRFAQSDATRFARVLKSLGGFRPEDVVVLHDPNPSTIRRTVIDINRRIRAHKDKAVLTVYYSGHADAGALRTAGSRMVLSEVRGLVEGSSAAIRILIVDACRSGAVTRRKGGRVSKGFDITLEAAPSAEGFVILTSSAPGEDAQESDEIRGSFFSHYLISALLGAADRDANGSVTLSEAFAYASTRTVAATARTGPGPQHPTFEIDLGGTADLVLTSPGVPTRGVGTLSFPNVGWYLVEQGGAIVAELKSSKPNQVLALPAGTYTVTRRMPSYLLRGNVRIASAQSVPMSGGNMKRIAYARAVRRGGTELERSWSVVAQVGLRGSIADLGISRIGGVGVHADLRRFAFELAVSAGQAQTNSRRLEITTTQLDVTGSASYVMDAGEVALSLGLAAGPVFWRQDFDDSNSKGRDAFGFLFGPVARAQISLVGRFYLRVDGVAEMHMVSLREEGGDTVDASLSYRVGMGVGAFF